MCGFARGQLRIELVLQTTACARAGFDARALSERLPLPCRLRPRCWQRRRATEPNRASRQQALNDGSGVPRTVSWAFEEPPFGERLVIIILHCQHIAVATRVQIANLHIIASS